MGLLEELGELEGLNASLNVNKSVSTNKLVADLDQPRKAFDEDELKSLAASIAERGILQPIVVRPEHDGKHVIVAGERRWRAAQIAGLAEVPFVVRKKHDSYDQVVENIQRSDLKHSEIARWILARLEDGDKAADIARRLGRSKAWVSKYVSYSKLPGSIADRVDEFGMDTAQKLLQAWNKDVDRTEWFLKTHDEITRGSASQFLDSLSEPAFPPTVDRPTQSGANSGPDASDAREEEAGSGDDFGTEPVEFEAADPGAFHHESPPKDEPEGIEFAEIPEPSGLEDDGNDEISVTEAAPTFGDTGSSGWVRGSGEEDDDKNGSEDGMIPVRGVYDPDTQIIRIVLNGKVTVSIKDGEEGQVRLSEII